MQSPQQRLTVHEVAFREHLQERHCLWLPVTVPVESVPIPMDVALWLFELRHSSDCSDIPNGLTRAEYSQLSADVMLLADGETFANNEDFEESICEVKGNACSPCLDDYIETALIPSKEDNSQSNIKESPVNVCDNVSPISETRSKDDCSANVVCERVTCVCEPVRNQPQKSSNILWETNPLYCRVGDETVKSRGEFRKLCHTTIMELGNSASTGGIPQTHETIYANDIEEVHQSEVALPRLQTPHTCGLSEDKQPLRINSKFEDNQNVANTEIINRASSLPNIHKLDSGVLSQTSIGSLQCCHGVETEFQKNVHRLSDIDGIRHGYSSSLLLQDHQSQYLEEKVGLTDDFGSTVSFSKQCDEVLQNLETVIHSLESANNIVPAAYEMEPDSEFLKLCLEADSYANEALEQCPCSSSSPKKSRNFTESSDASDDVFVNSPSAEECVAPFPVQLQVHAHNSDINAIFDNGKNPPVPPARKKRSKDRYKTTCHIECVNMSESKASTSVESVKSDCIMDESVAVKSNEMTDAEYKNNPLEVEKMSSESESKDSAKQETETICNGSEKDSTKEQAEKRSSESELKKTEIIGDKSEPRDSIKQQTEKICSESKPNSNNQQTKNTGNESEPKDSAKPQTENTSSVSEPKDSAKPQTENTGSVSEPKDSAKPQTENTGSVSEPKDSAKPQTENTGSVSEPKDSAKPQTKNTGNESEPKDSAKPQTENTSSVSEPKDSAKPQTENTGSVSEPKDSAKPQTENTGSVSEPKDSAKPQTENTGSVSEPKDSAKPQAKNTGSVSEPKDSAKPQTENTGNESVPKDSAKPQTENTDNESELKDSAKPQAKNTDSVSEPKDKINQKTETVTLSRNSCFPDLCSESHKSITSVEHSDINAGDRVDDSVQKSSSEEFGDCVNVVLTPARPIFSTEFPPSENRVQDICESGQLGVSNNTLSEDESDSSFICESVVRRRKGSTSSDITAWKQELQQSGLGYLDDEWEADCMLQPDEWFSSNDSEGRVYFFEENSHESTWALPELTITVCDSPSTAKPPPIEPPTSKKKPEPNEKQLESVQLRAEHLAAELENKTQFRMAKAHSMVLVDSRGSQASSKSSSIPRNWPQLWDGDLCVLKEGTLNRTKITENGKKLRKNWAPAHVVLTELFLLFFKDAKTFASMKNSQGKSASSAAHPEFSVDLNGALLEHGEKASSRRNVFLVSTVLGLQVLLQCENAQQEEEWYQSIKKAIENLPSPYVSTPRSKAVKMTPQHLSCSSPEETKRSSRIGRSRSVKVKPSTSQEDLTASPDENQTKIRNRLKKFFHRRPPKEVLVKKGIYKDEPVFGCHLPDVCKGESPRVPAFVQRCVAAIESKEENMKTDGLYRASGNLSQVQKIRLQVDQNNLDTLEQEEDVHVLTGALKLFFRELQKPLIPFEHFHKALRASMNPNKKEKLQQFRDIVKALPLPNRDTLEFLLRHLLRVTEHKESNRMHIPNLAIVFGPTLMWSEGESLNMALDLMQQNLVIECFLQEFSNIFKC
ncbi:uncharacterized protein [Periplaneta americana]|uniref:uncharacterized protein isoform X2 n=1 Tax=Periplaneta americana TaxID=6978 RepID=UPI0037E7841F